MKKMFMAVMVLVVLGAMNTGCGKPNSKAPISNAAARGARGGNGAGGTIDASLLQGKVFQFDGMENEFQTAVKDFLSSSIPEEFVGYVSGAQGQSNTGFFIGGRVTTQTGRFNPSGMSRTSFNSNGQVGVAVYDEYTGRTDEIGQQIPPASISYTNISGEINGQNVILQASDEYNAIYMDGVVNGQYFEGRIYYKNFKTHDDSSPSPGYNGIGWFRVNACSMFACQ